LEVAGYSCRKQDSIGVSWFLGKSRIVFGVANYFWRKEDYLGGGKFLVGSRCIVKKAGWP
jgi:hypothetical protein